MPNRTRLVWKTDPFSDSMPELRDKMDKAIGRTMEYSATNLQNHMRTNAPWTDRTSNARNGLFGTYRKDTSRHRIILYHTMPYGIWLEVRHNARFAIIRPTIESQGPGVMNLLRGILKRIS